VSPSLKALAADPTIAGIKKTDLFRVDPRLLSEEEGFNLRDYNDPKVIAHIETFCDSYTNGRYVPALIVRTMDDGRIVPVEGHCRRRGALLAIERGALLPFVDVIQFRGNDAERVEVMLRSAEGLGLEPLAVAEGYLRLERMGHDSAQIAKSQNKTVVRVEQLLTLARANSDVHALVRDGKVSVDVAITAVREHGEAAGKMLSKIFETAQREGRQKVTKSVFQGPSAPRKTVEAVFSRVETALAQVPATLLELVASLDDAPEEEVGGGVVEVDANVLLGLLRAGKEIAAMKAKHAAKAARREVAAQEAEVSSDEDGFSDTEINMIPAEMSSTAAGVAI
jgi:ParB family chromosome partitioning protein